MIPIFGSLMAALAKGAAISFLAAVWADFLDDLRSSPIPVHTKGNTAMAGYLNRVISIPFPELAGTDENNRAIVWVTIRNPKLIPGGELLSSTSVQLGPDGQPVDSDAAAGQTFDAYAKLIIAGVVYDPTWEPNPGEEDLEPPILPMPPSPADVAKYPIEILNKIGQELKNSVPR